MLNSINSGKNLRAAMVGVVAFAMISVARVGATPVASQVVLTNNQQLIIEPQREVFKDPYALSVRDLGAPSVNALSSAASPLAALGGSPFMSLGGGGGGGGGGFTSPLATVSYNSVPIVTGYNNGATAHVAAAVNAAIAAADPAGVPEGGATLLLLGISLLALFLAGRRWMPHLWHRERGARR